MWIRKDNLDVKNGVILSALAIIVVLYSKLLHQKSLTTSNFSPKQKALDNQNYGFVTEPAGSQINVQPTDIITETQTVHFDGLVKYTRINHNVEANLLILTLTKDATSWGRDVGTSLRTFHDFLDLLIGTGLNLTTTSLALWTSSEDQYHLFRTATSHLNLARTSIFFDPSADDGDRGSRHNPDHEMQTYRRAKVARLRNKLMLHSLGREPHLLWLDADVQYYSPGTIQLMLSHSSTNATAGIITARCQDGPTYNYDKNAWAGSRNGDVHTGSFDPSGGSDDANNVVHLVDELIEGTNNGDLVPLDAVGGTILYMRASLVWEGLTFPSYYTIGTRWGQDGWDGIETEGLCYLARNLDGGGCYVLGGENYVRHTNL